MASLLSGSSAMNAGAAVSATDKRKEQMASLTPRRVAIKFSPPTLILEYAPSFGRYLHYKVRMGHLRPSTDPYAVANRLYRDHPRFFDRAKVEFGQTLKLVRKLIDNAGAASPVAPSPPPARAAPPPASYGDDFEDDFEDTPFPTGFCVQEEFHGTIIDTHDEVRPVVIVQIRHSKTTRILRDKEPAFGRPDFCKVALSVSFKK